MLGQGLPHSAQSAHVLIVGHQEGDDLLQRGGSFPVSAEKVIALEAGVLNDCIHIIQCYAASTLLVEPNDETMAKTLDDVGMP